MYQDYSLLHNKRVYLYALVQNVSERQIRFTTNKPVVDVLDKIKTVLMEMGFCVQKKHTMVTSPFVLIYYLKCLAFSLTAT